MKNIYSILVTYNPSELELITAINRLKAQTDLVVICNNSNYAINIKDENIKVFNFFDNLGIAKAQSIGMKWAFENGADFILQMDQDSVPHDNLVNELYSCYRELTQKGYNIGLVGSQDYDKDTKEKSIPRYKKGHNITDTKYILIEQILSSGSLIPIKSYNSIGGMDDELFIDAVDFEYCWRLKHYNYLIIKNPDALIGHKLGRGNKKIFGFITIGISAPIRHYYQTRNTILLLKRNYVPVYWKTSSFLKLLFKIIIFPFVLDQGLKRLSYMLKGLKDGFLNKTGRIDNGK